MITTRWRKVWRDLATNKVRTALVVVAIAIGVMTIGAVAGARSIVLRSLAASEATVNSASATLLVSSFDDALVETVRGTPGVSDEEGRRSLNVRVATAGDQAKTLELFVVPDYRQISIDRIQPESGAWPPPPETMLLERASLKYLGWTIGDVASIETPDGTRRKLPIEGTVHDLSQPASTITGVVYGYISFETLEGLGEPSDLNELHIKVTGHGNDRQYIQSIASTVRNQVEDSGHTVISMSVPEPGRFWAQDYMESLLALLAILGGVCLFLSGFLVVNTVSALMAQQVRQIGVMKAVGADLRQIAGLYLSMVLAYGMLAVAIGIPIGAYLGQWLVGYSTATLNVDAIPFGVSPDALALEITAALVLPVLAASPSILAGSRITVREAIASYGLGGGAFGGAILDRLLQRLGRLSRPMLLSLRNTVRRKGRLALTLGTLTLGGAIFIAVLSVQVSLTRTIDDIYRFTNFDIQITFSEPYPLTQVQRLAAVSGVAGVQGSEFHSARRMRADGSEGGQLQLTAPPPGTTFLVPVVLQGRWLVPGDQNALVINSDVRRDESDLGVGRDVKLKIEGEESTWHIVGVARGTLSGPIIYANAPYVARLVGNTGDLHQLQIVVSEPGAARTQAIARALEERFKAAGLQVSTTDVVSEHKALLATNFSIIVNFLLSMAVLVAIVGGLGLTATMSISVLERTREIGVMRAIGASDGDVMRIVIGEGLALGTVSWIGAVIVAVPMGWLLCAFVGAAFLHESIGFTFPAAGALLWLAGALALSAAASFTTAWNATRLTVRDVLNYE